MALKCESETSSTFNNTVHLTPLLLSLISIPRLWYSSMNFADVLMVAGYSVALQPQISIYFQRKKRKYLRRQLQYPKQNLGLFSTNQPL